MQHVQVINLDKDQIKMERMHDMLSELGMQYERVPAVHGSSLTMKQRRELTSNVDVYLLPPSVIGCFASHRRAWQRVVDEGWEGCMILEDDARFEPDFLRLFRERWQQVPVDFDFVTLGNLANTHASPRWYEMLHTATSHALARREVSDNVYVPSLIMGTHAYVVSQMGARKLLSLLPRADGHVDLRIGAKLPHLQAYGIRPALAYQRDMHESNITAAAPLLLNMAASQVVATQPPLQLTLAWLLSEPAFKLIGDDFVVCTWTLLFLVLGAVSLRCALMLLVADASLGFVFTDDVKVSKTLGGYVTLALAAVAGHCGVVTWHHLRP